jgi:hypothetical protein
MFNKKGQEMSIGTLILIILGLVVLVVVIIGFTTGFGWLADIFGLAPGNLEKITQSCIISAQGDLTASYCAEFKELESNHMVNCQYNLVEPTVKDQAKELDCDLYYKAPEYSDSGEKGAAEWYCKGNVLADKWDKTKVNGKTCQDWGFAAPAAPVECSDIPGTDTTKEGVWVADADACSILGGTDVTTQVTDDSGKGTSTVCCLKTK